MSLFHLVLIILYRMTDSVIYGFQHIQNTAAYTLAKCGNSFSKVILNKLQWLSIKQRMVYTILITTYKAYNSIAPKYGVWNDQMNIVP